ncbi:MAG: hypothetical protein E6J79_03375 [Deltaproteobacteria bacterium]|nr:MAG: hypothetical protein E6J79_03375 [Deltaproteobacteria bacterium]
MKNASRRLSIRLGVAAALLAGSGVGSWAIVTEVSLVDKLHGGVIEHEDETKLRGMRNRDAYNDAFTHGDAIFSDLFNAVDGAGANVGNGARFTRFPRPDLVGKDAEGRLMWASHIPKRITGPDTNSCNSCHALPAGDGAADTGSNVIRDPGRTGNPALWISRNAPHVFGLGAVQRLAEEMTAKLKGIRDGAQQDACTSGAPVTTALAARGTNFGSITVSCDGTVDTSAIEGIDKDLIVKPFQWKGSKKFIRDFVRGAATNEIGMQGVELVGEGVDGDGDGVVDELTIGDVTALTMYQPSQPRPVTKLELASIGLLQLSDVEKAAIKRGTGVFGDLQCDTCHKPQMKISNPIFSEPSQMAEYRDAKFPSGADPVSLGIDPAHPMTFDLTRDTPENVLTAASCAECKVLGSHTLHLGAFKKDSLGRAIINLYGDLKRHDMGPGLAEAVDEVGTGASVFLTRTLWGVGSTAPYMHDGRSSTLTRARRRGRRLARRVHGGVVQGPGRPDRVPEQPGAVQAELASRPRIRAAGSAPRM